MCSARADFRFTPESDRESGHPQTTMSALPLKADMCSAVGHVCFGPIADILRLLGRFAAACHRWITRLIVPIQYRRAASTERRVRRSIFALLVLTTTAHAQLVILTCDQWELVDWVARDLLGGSN
jgi:hypothetical protein